MDRRSSAANRGRARVSLSNNKPSQSAPASQVPLAASGSPLGGLSAGSHQEASPKPSVVQPPASDSRSIISTPANQKPSLSTDKSDYAAGEVVAVTATGFRRGASVRFSLADDPAKPGLDGDVDNYGSFVVRDGSPDDLDGVVNGRIVTRWMVPTDNNRSGTGIPDALGASVVVTAQQIVVGRCGNPTTQAQGRLLTTSFTDATGILSPVSGVQVSLDETPGLQNKDATPSPDGDKDDNDIAIDASGNPGIPQLPVAFASRLTTFGAPPLTSDGAALSGYDGSNSGLDIFTRSGSAFDLTFTDISGHQLNGFNSGLLTRISYAEPIGYPIFLYTDLGAGSDNNIVLGRAGTASGVADPNGKIVFAAYIEETSTGGKIWTIQYTPLEHKIGGDPDDRLSLLDMLYIGSAGGRSDFSFANAPSGQNLFLMLGGQADASGYQTGIVVTGKNPANQRPGVNFNTGDTVNTSQGGGFTTIGVNNQMIDPPTAKIKGEGIYFTFVKRPVDNYTIPKLDQNEADIQANIQFADILDTCRAAGFTISQTQPAEKMSTVKLSAKYTANQSGSTFVNGLSDDVGVSIVSVVVKDANGNILIDTLNGTSENGSLKVVFKPNDASNSGVQTATIIGMKSKYSVEYGTASDHNRVLIENAGNSNAGLNASFDIGAFTLIQGVSVSPMEIGSKVRFEDDGPKIDVEVIGGSPILEVDETSLAVDASGSYVADFKNLPDYGTDGSGSVTSEYTLGISATPPTGLVDVETGQPVFLFLENDQVIGRAGSSGDPDPSGAEVFIVSVIATGENAGFVTLDQRRALRHNDPNDSNDTVTFSLPELITLTRTDRIFDWDNDFSVDSEAIKIAQDLIFRDDGPSVGAPSVGDEVTLDETTARDSDGSGFVPGLTATSVTAIIDAPLKYGADDAAASNAVVYGLSVIGDGTTSLKTASGDQAITLVLVDADTIEGRYGAGNVAFRLDINANGTLTVTQDVALEHLVDGDGVTPANSYNDELTLSGLVKATVTITDGDGDTATNGVEIGSAVKFLDDGPSVGAPSVGDEVTLDETTARDSDGSGFVPGLTATSVTAIIDAPLKYGADDAAASNAVVYGLSVIGDGTTSLKTASGDQAITLVLVDADTIEGRYGAGNVAFRLDINANGTLTVTQDVALEHLVDGDGVTPANSYNDELTLSGLVKATVTITDGDGDTATNGVEIGSAVKFLDDGPSVGAPSVGDEVTLDETTARDSDGSGFVPGLTATSVTAIIDAPLKYGADDAAASNAVVYGLSVIGDGTTSLKTASGDQAITLVLVDADTIEGRYGAGNVAFRLDINANGTLTVTQDVALEHLVDGDGVTPANSYNDELTLSGLVKATVTITDGDGDTATNGVEIGSAVKFLDDGPSVGAPSVGDEVTLDETTARDSDGSGFVPGLTATSVTAIIDAPLKYGADDAAASNAVVYGLSVIGDGTTSLKTASGDQAITLVLVDADTIEGRYGAGNVAFRLDINANGTLTVTQDVALEHLVDGDGVTPANSYNDELTLSGLVKATVTITDGDGDTATNGVEIGSAVKFLDDGPSVGAPSVGDEVTLDETTARDSDGSGFVPGLTATSVTAIIDAPLKYGADDAAASNAVVYGLSVIGDGTTSLKTASGDQAITLVLVDADTIEGRYGAGNVAFRLDINANGTLTVTQDVALEHLVDGDGVTPANSYNDELTLSGLVKATVTITDGDGDTATNGVEIGSAVKFLDDGPSVGAPSVGDEVTLDETTARDSDGSGFVPGLTATSVTAIIDAPLKYGADDAAASNAVVYGLSVIGDGTTSLKTASGDQAITLVLVDADTIEGRYGAGNVAFRLDINANGTLTVTQDVALEHLVDGDGVTPANSYNDELTLSGLVKATVTITDGDGDTATNGVEIGSAVKFLDDGPSVGAPSVGDEVTLDETTARDSDGSGFVPGLTATSVTAIIDAPLKYGADDAAASNAVVYGLSVIGDGTTSLKTASGDQAITLVLVDADTIEGRYGAGNVAFRLDINANGTLTVTQDVALEHLVDGDGVTPANSYNDELTLSGLVKATVTITDGDGDTATNGVEIGSAVKFLDDGPSVGAPSVGDEVTLDETTARDSDGSGFVPGLTATSVTAIIDAPLKYGADDAAASNAVVYGLSVIGDGTTSLKTASGDQAITLVLVDADTIEGRYGAGNVAFRLDINANGTLTVTQDVALEHLVDGDGVTPANSYNDELTLSGLVKATVTITDGDGDTATNGVEIGSAVKFRDDGPAITPTGTPPTLTVDETFLSVDASQNFAPNFTYSFGADGSGSLVYALSLKSATSGLRDTRTNDLVALQLVGNDKIQGFISGGVVVFELTLDGSGNVKLDQRRSVVHSPNTGPDQATGLSDASGADLVKLVATITDGDGDSATAALNIADLLVFKDDAPSSFLPAALTLTNAKDASGVAYLDVSDHNIDDNYGADQPGRIAFTGLTNGQVAQGVIDGSGGLQTLTSGGQPIYLYLADHDASGATPDRLEGRIGGASGPLIYTVTLSPDGSSALSNDLYQLDLRAPIGFSTQTTITNFGSVKSGNSPFASLDISGIPQDLLFSATTRAPSGTASVSTVNVSTTGLAVSNQSINDGEALRIDFVNNVDTGKAGGQDWYNYDPSGTGHYYINDFQFAINQVNTPGGTGTSDSSIEVWVRIFDASGGDPYPGTTGTTAQHAAALADDPQLNTITKVTVLKFNAANLPDPSGERVFTPSSPGILIDASGGWLISGLDLNDRVMVSASGSGYQAIEIQNANSLSATDNLAGEAFDIGRLGYVTTSSRTPRVDLSYNAVLTDADGDQSPAAPLNITLTAPSPLMLAADPITGGAMLDPINLGSVEAAAIDFWRSRGADAQAIERLQETDVLIGQLQGSMLGCTDGVSITLDDDAAGHGWSDSLQSVARGQADLYSSLVHEYGHVLGYDHDVLGETLALGTRQLPLTPTIDLPLC